MHTTTNAAAIDATIRAALSEAGYGEDVITFGLEYADQCAATDIADRGSLAVSRILYSDADLADGRRFAWAPNA